jgi:hypothetical protein
MEECIVGSILHLISILLPLSAYRGRIPTIILIQLNDSWHMNHIYLGSLPKLFSSNDL